MKIFNITSNMTPKELKELYKEAFTHMFVYGEVAYKINYLYNEPNIK
jgi:hypothetical protein